MNTGGLGTALRIQLRTGWQPIMAWVVALAATLFGTTLAISTLYDTPAEVAGYARALGQGRAMAALNGHVYGVDTLGGVIANEFGFVASFALPLMGISLIARATRGEEESGRLEALLAGRVGRTAPLISAILLAAAALTLTAVALAAGLVTAGVDGSDAIAYATALGTLGLWFAGVATVVAQLVGHAREVYAVGLGVLVIGYLLRGTGAVLDNALVWLSPLGWAQETRAFADTRWWPVLLSVGSCLLLIIVAIALNTRRDLGSAPLHRGGGPPAASVILRSRLGFALRLHRGAVIGWSIAAIIVAGMFGLLAEPTIDAIAGNRALQQTIGGAGIDGFLATAVLLLGLLCGGYVVQTVGTLRTEETAGRLESTLSGPVHRSAWLGVHLGVVLAGLAVIASLGALVLGSTTAWSTGDSTEVSRLVGATTSYLPAVLVLAAIAFALFAMVPRLFVLGWLLVAFNAGVSLLGDALSLPGWLMDLAPMNHVGFPPQDLADPPALAMLVAAAVLFGAAAFAAFGRRPIPRG